MNFKAATLVLLLASAAPAQPLAGFLEAAERANFDARTSATNTEQAEASLGQAWGGLLPALSATGGWTHNQYQAVVDLPTGATTSQQVVIIPKDQLEANLRAEVPLVDPARWLQAAAAASSAQAAGQREAATRVQVRRQVVSAFYGYLGARAVLASAQRSLALALAQVEIAEARKEAGVANELALMRARAEVSRNQQLVADAETLEATSARTLETLTGLAPREVPPLPEDPLTPVLPLEQLEAGGADTLPEVKAADEEVSAASRTAAAGALALVPTVNGQFTQRFTNATGFQGASALYNAGLTFNWRLDLTAVQGLRALNARQAAASIAAERARRLAGDQLHGDWHRARAAVKKVQAARAQVVAASRASALAHERELAGVATQLDVIQAERDLFAAELSDIQANAELASARALLALSAGQPLEVRP